MGGDESRALGRFSDRCSDTDKCCVNCTLICFPFWFFRASFVVVASGCGLACCSVHSKNDGLWPDLAGRVPQAGCGGGFRHNARGKAFAPAGCRRSLLGGWAAASGSEFSEGIQSPLVVSLFSLHRFVACWGWCGALLVLISRLGVRCGASGFMGLGGVGGLGCVGWGAGGVGASPTGGS